MIDLAQLDDVALQRYAAQLERDLLEGVEVSAHGVPLIEAVTDVRVEVAQRQQRRDLGRMSLEALHALREHVEAEQAAAAEANADPGWRARLVLLHADVTAEVDRRSHDLRLALGTQQAGGTN